MSDVELAKALRNIANYLSEQKSPLFPIVIRQAADAIEKLICEVAEEHNGRLDAEEKIPRWISVNERLPEPGEYLVLKTSHMGKPHYYWQIVSYADNLYKVDRYSFSYQTYKHPGWYSYDSEYGYYETGDGITYWMPLPESPEEET